MSDARSYLCKVRSHFVGGAAVLFCPVTPRVFARCRWASVLLYIINNFLSLEGVKP